MVDRAEIVVKPIECLFEPRCERESVAGLQDDLTLVRGWGAKKM